MKLELESLTRETYSITPKLDGKRLFVKLAGTFDMTSAAPLQAYLEAVRSEARRLRILELLIDVSEVYYLGSSCIKCFVSLTVNLQRGTAGMLLRLLINSRLDWQERAFAVLSRLAPGRFVVQPI